MLYFDWRSRSNNEKEKKRETPKLAKDRASQMVVVSVCPRVQQHSNLLSFALHVFVCKMNMCVRAHVNMYTHVEAWGWCWGSSSTALYLILLMQGLSIKPRLTRAASFSSQFILETPASNFQGWVRRGLSLPPDICMCSEDPNTGSLAGIAISSTVGQSPKPQISKTKRQSVWGKVDLYFVLFWRYDPTM